MDVLITFFAHHYWLAVALPTVALIVIFGAFLLRRGPVGRFAGIVTSLAVVALCVPAMIGAHQADEEKDAGIRHAVLAKYAVTVDKWGEYRARHGEELTSIWTIDGEHVTCTVKAMDKPSDPVLFVCGGQELPRAAA